MNIICAWVVSCDPTLLHNLIKLRFSVIVLIERPLATEATCCMFYSKYVVYVLTLSITVSFTLHANMVWKQPQPVYVPRLLPLITLQCEWAVAERGIRSWRHWQGWPLTIGFCRASLSRGNASANTSHYPFCYGNYRVNKLQLLRCYLSSPFGLWRRTSEESLSLESCSPRDPDEHSSTCRGPTVLWREWSQCKFSHTLRRRRPAFSDWLC